MKTKQELEQQADAIMNSFSFETVRDYMYSINWEWRIYGEEDNRVPTVDELKAEARSLLTKAIWNDREVIDYGTGGFTAVKFSFGMRLFFNIG